MLNQICGQKELRLKVRESHLCTGCGACVNLCPYQISYRDQIIEWHLCDIEKGRCYAYCPRTRVNLDALKTGLFEERYLTPEVGAIRGFYVTRAADASIRDRAQHGGTVTALMSLALQEGIIDTGIVADDGQRLLSQGVSLNKADELKKKGKSRFAVSPNIAEFNRQAQAGGKKIGIVVTPCQSLALAKMRTKPVPTHAERIDQLKLVIGLFCGWALSWEKLSFLLDRKGINLKDIEGMDIPPSKYQLLQVYTKKGSVDIPLDEVDPACVREACRYCPDMTAEFTDVSVGSARLPEGWEVAKGWNQVIVRTELGEKLIDLARSKRILEFHDVPEGNLELLKKASMNKKRAAVENLSLKSGSPENLIYLDFRDPVFGTILGRLA